MIDGHADLERLDVATIADFDVGEGAGRVIVRNGEYLLATGAWDVVTPLLLR
jgi:hypothetical protein